MSDRSFEPERSDYLIRPRVIALLTDAVKRPLTVVCAGAGCGKTRAVFEFTRQTAYRFAWIHFSERDNAGSRFWAKYIQVIERWDERFAGHCREFGFPDTEDKINRHLALRRRYISGQKSLIILDDIHLISHPDILLFLKYGLREAVKNTSVILICRKVPDIDLSGMQIRGLVPVIAEEDLNFTESELELYLRQQSVTVSKQSLRDIFRDTEGWAFSVNLIARSLKKSPGYEGYVRVAMKRNIFRLMETEVFNNISERLQRFLVRLSLIDHLSGDFVERLAKGDRELLDELGRQNAYIRFDNDINAYLIHHLFLDFLHTKETILTREEVSETYHAAARWCALNGFESDALNYQEKVGDYEAMTGLLSALPVQMSYDIALQAAGIFERAPKELSDRICLFAVMHVRVLIRLGRCKEALALAKQYEERFLLLPEDDPFRNRTMGLIYYSLGNLRALMGTADGCYDFDVYYAKMDECLTKAYVEPDQYADMPIGFWASLAGSERRGAPQEYIEAASRAAQYISHCWGGSATGIDTLCRGELLFYQGDMKAAEPLLVDAIRQARQSSQFEIEHKAIFYLMRLALWQGNRGKAEQALKEMETKLEEKSYSHRFINNDVAAAWYFCTLRRPEEVSAWLKEKFATYGHAYFIENLGNQLKACYHYITGNYAPLLAYIEGTKRREAILYGRVEMLAIEACVYFRLKNKPAALKALQKAYETAVLNNILTPFAELGKDMRTLASAAMRGTDCGIPCAWLEIVKRKAAAFAKHQSLMISNYEKIYGSHYGKVLTAREKEILSDLYNGLSRSEIAVKQTLSINTVNSAVNNIYNKLGAHTIVDVVRIAAEEKLV